MPVLSLGDVRLFVRRSGLRTGPPILLIHGALADGAADWAAIAAQLAPRHDVVVPDCRGHGRSPDPAGDYRFATLAADLTALVGQIGRGPAHVVGHSNGGNVALVMLVEHPHAVATAVLQGANAYVSPNLVQVVPRALDPDRVEREAPDWRDVLAARHRALGPDGWRRLLVATAEETVRAPAYSAADLAGVTRRTLVIEGADDELNAAAGHGAFLARHIPGAELWRPAATGHAVHQERAAEWLGRVEAFWAPHQQSHGLDRSEVRRA